MVKKNKGKIVRIRIGDILYIEALKEYVRIFTTEGNQVVYQTMQSMEDRLPKDSFFRIHRSYIAGLRHVQEIEGNTVIVNGIHLPVSRYCKDDFINRVAKNKLF